MEFLGIGPLELLFIFLIALIVLGPKDIVKTSKTVGRFLRKIVTSPQWRTINQTSKEIRNLPNRLIREAGMEEEIKQIQDLQKSLPDLKKARIDLDLKNQTPTIHSPEIAGVAAAGAAATGQTTDTPADTLMKVEPVKTSDESVPDQAVDSTDALTAWTTPPASPEADTDEKPN